MKLIVLAACLTFSLADKLNNVYLPPISARTAGGNPSQLQAPSPVSSYAAAPSGLVSRAFAQPATILRYSNDNDGEGAYSFEYETDNQISHRESGQLKTVAGSEAAVVARGSYSYTAPDGHVYTIDYVADENGFQPVGAHIPTPPPFPVEIQRSLALNAAAERSNVRLGANYLPPQSNGGYRY